MLRVKFRPGGGAEVCEVLKGGLGMEDFAYPVVIGNCQDILWEFSVNIFSMFKDNKVNYFIFDLKTNSIITNPYSVI